MNTYLSSSEIELYPSAYRGQTSDNKLYNPESRLFTEKNITNDVRDILDTDSYVVRTYSDIDTPASDYTLTLATGYIYFVIHGYRFFVKLSGLDLSTTETGEVYANIKLAKKNTATVTATSYNGLSLININDNTASVLDVSDKFQGVKFSASVESGSYSLLILQSTTAGTWFVPQASKLKLSTRSIYYPGASESLSNAFNDKDTAKQAAKLTVTTTGSEFVPVYFDNGIPVECGDVLKTYTVASEGGLTIDDTTANAPTIKISEGGVTNTMLFGSIDNDKLSNSYVGIGSTVNLALGESLILGDGLASSTVSSAKTLSLVAASTVGTTSKIGGIKVNRSGTIANQYSVNIDANAFGYVSVPDASSSSKGLLSSAYYSLLNAATAVNTEGTLVKRDEDGNFNAGDITASTIHSSDGVITGEITTSATSGSFVGTSSIPYANIYATTLHGALNYALSWTGASSGTFTGAADKSITLVPYNVLIDKTLSITSDAQGQDVTVDTQLSSSSMKTGDVYTLAGSGYDPSYNMTENLLSGTSVIATLSAPWTITMIKLQSTYGWVISYKNAGVSGSYGTLRVASDKVISHRAIVAYDSTRPEAVTHTGRISGIRNTY